MSETNPDGDDESEERETIHDKIEKFDWECDVHGELDAEGLGITTAGQIVCNFCSVNQEAAPHRRDEIDPRVEPEWEVGAL